MGRRYTKEEVIESAKANAHHFIQNLPDKHETKITERGSNFSVVKFKGLQLLELF